MEMNRTPDRAPRRSSMWVGTAAVAAMVAAFLVAPGTASAQVAAADIDQFMGTWELPLDAQGQPFDMTIAISEGEDGAAAATVEDMIQTGQTEVEYIGLNGEELELEYTSNYQGMDLPILIRLIPTDDEMMAEVDLAEGQFFMDGTATKVE